MKHILYLLAISAIIPALAWAVPHQSLKRPAPVYPIMTGNEVVNAPAVDVVPPAPAINETDLLGDTTTIGMTWTDVQHNGTCGRMNTLEPNGWRQFVWMKGENNGATSRHVWWNGIDPNGVPVYPGVGIRFDTMEESFRGGYTVLDVGSNGSGFPSFYESGI